MSTAGPRRTIAPLHGEMLPAASRSDQGRRVVERDRGMTQGIPQGCRPRPEARARTPSHLRVPRGERPTEGIPDGAQSRSAEATMGSVRITRSAGEQAPDCGRLGAHRPVPTFGGSGATSRFASEMASARSKGTASVVGVPAAPLFDPKIPMCRPLPPAGLGIGRV